MIRVGEYKNHDIFLSPEKREEMNEHEVLSADLIFPEYLIYFKVYDDRYNEVMPLDMFHMYVQERK
jgi:hypothetical protein